ncbi:MAG: glycerol acyltransferase [Paludibacteraceae bacterium]|nr:glycerol acyltransferase [Paludibacteraceae bacterium]
MQISVADIVNQRRQAAGKRCLPHWVFRPLERLICQDEINAGLARYGHLPPYDFLRAVIHDILGCSYTLHLSDSSFTGVPGGTRFTDSPNPLFVSNHPLGGLDGMILILALHDLGYDVRVIVNDFLLALQPLAPLFVPVNKVGGQKREYVEQMRQLWSGPTPILSFPAGACSRLIDGKVQDLPWRPTYLKNAATYHREIIRLRFEGRNSMLFYRVAQLRAWLHIPFNIEMLLLPREMFRAHGSHYHIYQL